MKKCWKKERKGGGEEKAFPFQGTKGREIGFVCENT